MLEPKLIDDLARRLAGRLPEGLGHLTNDLQANFKAVLQSTLGKMDLVTRREFDVQRAVLERTREKLTGLLERLDELERQRADETPDSAPED